MWGLIVMQWLHVLLDMFWFGSTLYLDVVVIPAVMTLPLEQQRSVSKPLTRLGERVIIPVAILVIILGLVRGTIFGPVKTWSFLLGTAYGLTFLLALLAALATLAWGSRSSIEQPGDSMPFRWRTCCNLRGKWHAPSPLRCSGSNCWRCSNCSASSSSSPA